MSIDFTKPLETDHTKPCPVCEGHKRLRSIDPVCQECLSFGVVPDPKPVSIEFGSRNGYMIRVLFRETVTELGTMLDDWTSKLFVCSLDGTVPGETWCVRNVAKEKKVEPTPTGEPAIQEMTALEWTIRNEFHNGSYNELQNDGSDLVYLLGVIDTLRWDRKLLRNRESEQAKPTPKEKIPEFRRTDGSIVRGWRTGSKVKKNVYDEFGEPVCQTKRDDQAEFIVAAVNDKLLQEQAKPAPEQPSISPGEVYAPGLLRDEDLRPGLHRHTPEEPKKRYRRGSVAWNSTGIIDGDFQIAQAVTSQYAQLIVDALNKADLSTGP